MSSSALESFFVALGFEIDSEKLNQFEEDVASARDTMMTLGAAAGAVAGAIGLFVHSIASGLDELGDFAEMEQYSVEALQELGHAAQLSGSDIGAVKSSLSAVNKTVGEAVLGIGRGAKAFESLGMSAKNSDGSVKSFDQILEEVADRMQGLSRQEQIAMAEKLGIDRSLIPMLAKGSDAIRELREEAKAFGIATESDVAIAGAYMDSFDRTTALVKGLAKSIALQFMPAMTRMMDGLRKWMLANKEVIKSSIASAMQVVIAVLGTLWDWIMRIGGALFDFTGWLFKSKVGVIMLAGALALIAKVAAWRTFFAIANGIKLVASALTMANTAALATSLILGALVIGLALLVDDFMSFKEGGESVIGDLVEKFPELLKVINALEEYVGYFIDFWMEQWNNLSEPLGDLGSAVWDLISVLAETLWPVVKTIFEGWGYLLAALLPVVIGVFANIVSAITLGISAVAQAVTMIINGITTVINFVMGVVDQATSKVMGFVDTVLGAISKVGELLGLTEKTPSVKVAVGSAGSAPSATAPGGVASSGGVIGKAGDQTSNATSTVNETKVNAPITIVTNDPSKAGESVEKHLNRMNKSTIRNGQTAVAL